MYALGLAARWLHLASSVLLVGAAAMIVMAGRSDRATAQRWERRVLASAWIWALAALASGVVIVGTQTALFEGRAAAAFEPRAIGQMLLETQAGEQDGAIQRGDGERERKQCELAEQQSSVARADQPGDTADVKDREPGARGGQQDDHGQRRAREAARGEDGVRSRVGALFRGGRPQQTRQRHEAADPDAGREHVQAVGCDRARGVGLDGGGVA